MFTDDQSEHEVANRRRIARKQSKQRIGNWRIPLRCENGGKMRSKRNQQNMETESQGQHDQKQESQKKTRPECTYSGECFESHVDGGEEVIEQLEHREPRVHELGRQRKTLCKQKSRKRSD